MKVIYFFWAFLFFFSIKGISQNYESKITISEAHIVHDTLKVLFKNNSNKSHLVPILNYRVGYDSKTMYEKFYSFSRDTLFIRIHKEIDRDLYSVKTTNKIESINRKLYYVDKKLNPKKTYWTSILIQKIGNPKILIIQFEDSIWACIIN